MKKLPIVGTSAASTAFCSERIDGPGGVGGLHLWVDGNGKITRDNGTLDAPRPNAFSLVQIADCPGSTATCRAGCYVHGLEANAKSTHDLYAHNSRTIREILADDRLASEWAMIFAHWISQNVTSFRWHVSGDVFGADYAEWIADVCRESPRVEHWIYTRSFQHADPLAKVSTIFGGNLAVNLSCDRDNYDAARAFHDRHIRVVVGDEDGGIGFRSLRMCYYTRDAAEAIPWIGHDGVIFPDYGLRAGATAGPAWFAALDAEHKKCVCPVDRLGKSEQRRCGPCDRCLT